MKQTKQTTPRNAFTFSSSIVHNILHIMSGKNRQKGGTCSCPSIHILVVLYIHTKYLIALLPTFKQKQKEKQEPRWLA